MEINIHSDIFNEPDHLKKGRHLKSHTSKNKT